MDTITIRLARQLNRAARDVVDAHEPHRDARPVALRRLEVAGDRFARRVGADPTEALCDAWLAAADAAGRPRGT